MITAFQFALSHALAQTSAVESTPTTLDAVVVTANKRVENVQEVPKSILVVTPEALSKTGVTTARELGNVIPSITASPSERSGEGTPSIRGISSFSFSIGVQTQTGIVIDDVPQASFSALYRELTDIERVEVLAGPQSTLSGRNASGGLINIVTRAPSDSFAAEVSLEHTSDRQQRASAFMTGPLSDTLAFSLTAFSNEWEGPLRSLTEIGPGQRPLHLSGWDTQGARGKLRWQPHSRLEATLTAWTMESTVLMPAAFPSGAYVEVDPAATYGVFTTPGPTMENLFPGLVVKKYNTWTGSPRHSTYNSRDAGGSVRVEYEFENAATLTSITSLSKSKLPMRDNAFGVPFPDGLDPYADSVHDTETKLQELRLTSPSGDAFTYLLGVVYSDTDTQYPYLRLGIAPVNWLRSVDIQSAALFARGTWNVGAHDALTAGFRYQHDDMGYGFAFLPLQAGATVPDLLVTGSNHYDFVSGELSWRHTLTDRVNAYATLAISQSGKVYDLEDNQGAMEPGGLQPLDSQKVRNLEMGLKGQWWERRLTTNLNVFLARYDHYHIQVFEPMLDPSAVPVINLFAIGKVETSGIEFETRLRATDRLDVNLNGTYLDATFKDYPNAPCYDRQTVAEGCIDGIQGNLAGTRMPNTPKLKLSGAANYFVPLDRLPFDLELGLSYRWQSKVWFDFSGNPNLYQNGFGILNLSATLLDHDGRYQLSLFVNNVLNQNFYSRLLDDARWSAPAYHGGYARDSFRYGGVRLMFHF